MNIPAPTLNHYLIPVALLVGCTSEDAPVAQLTFLGGESAKFEASITESEQSGTRYLNIACLENCRGKNYFQEQFLDYPIGIFKVIDSSDLLYIVSSSGSAYQIRVFRTNSEEVKKVLEQSSVAVPSASLIDEVETVTVYSRSTGRANDELVPTRLGWSVDAFAEVP